MGLPTDSIDSTRWIKPTSRRTVGQRTAHLITKLCSPEAANQALRDGLIIEGKRVWAGHMKKEPRRCLKCQSMASNHLAAECDQNTICGTCGKEHRTAECSECDQKKYWCVNCNLHGHASWDRTCPKFLDRSKRLEQLNPESMYTYFPTNEPWTWEQTRNPEAKGQATNDSERSEEHTSELQS